MKLIAISGRKQSGKDTLGNFLIADYGAKKYGWADSLKRMIGDLFVVPDEWLWGTEEDKNNLTCVKWKDLPHWYVLVTEAIHRGETEKEVELRGDQYLTVRELLQQFGTGIVRTMYCDAWVNAGKARLRREKPKFAVIIDMRFPNELFAVKELGGKCIRLTRKQDEPANHESEWSLDPDKFDWRNFDAVIDNSKMNLKEQEEALVNVMKGWGWI
ncbi:hypothetical protein C4577_03605 [Candidatus Parcubacteria bacterium]|nr:MAG: hypothetical protein C4577_03605 [Candidatus Parcubacteria bacterium]